MKLNTIQIFTLGAALSAAVSGVFAQQASQFQPEAFRPARYVESISANPFEREILKKEAPGPITQQSFGLSVIGATGDGERYSVVLVDRKGRYQVITEQPNADGFYYTGIKPSERIQDFEVQVTRGGQLEWAVFDNSRFSFKAPKKSDRLPEAIRVIEEAKAAALEEDKLNRPVPRKRVVLPPTGTPKK